MTTGLLKRTVGGSLLGISLLLGYGVATQAQSRDGYWQDRNGYYQDRDRDRDRDRDNQDYQRNRRGRNWDQYGQYGGSFQARQTALNAGYNAGIKQGRKNRNRGYYRVDFWSF